MNYTSSKLSTIHLVLTICIFFFIAILRLNTLHAASPTLVTQSGNSICNIVAFSLNGKLAASGGFSPDKSVYIYDVASGRQIRQIDGHTGTISAIAFSKDNNHVISGDIYGNVLVHNIATGEETLRQSVDARSLKDIVVLPSTGELVFAVAGIVSFRNLEDLVIKRVLHKKKAYATDLAVSKFGRFLAVGSADGKAYLYDLEDAGMTNVFDFNPNKHRISATVSSVAFSPDNRFVAVGGNLGISGDNGYVRIWDLQSSKLLGDLRQDKWVKVVRFNMNGDLLTLSYDGTCRLWNIAEHIIMEKVAKIHRSNGSSAVISPDGRFLLTDGLSLHDASSLDLKYKLFGKSSPLTSIAASSKDTFLATGDFNGMCFVWDLKKGYAKRLVNGHNHIITTMEFASDGKTLLTAGADQTVNVWDVKESEQLDPKVKPPGITLSVDFSHDGSLIVTSGTDHEANIWDVVTGHLIKSFGSTGGGGTIAAFSPKGDRILFGNVRGEIVIADVNSGSIITRKKLHYMPTGVSAFSPDGSLIVSTSAGISNPLHFLNAITGDLFFQINGSYGYVTSLSFSNNGKTLVTGHNDKLIRLWDIEARSEKRRLRDKFSSNHLTEFSNDEKHVITVTRYPQVVVWDLEPESFKTQIKKLEGGCKTTAISYDKQWLAVGGNDGVIRVFNILTGKVIGKIGDDNNKLLTVSLAFSPDKKRLVSSCSSGLVQVWDISNLTDISEACRLGKKLAISTCRFDEFLENYKQRSLPMPYSLKDNGGIRGYACWSSFTTKLGGLHNSSNRKKCGDFGPIFGLAISPDGRNIATAEWGAAIRMLDCESGLSSRFVGHKGSVSNVTFTPDSSELLSTGFDGNTILWNLETHKGKTLATQEKPIRSAIISRDGKYAFTGSDDETVKILDLSTGNVQHIFKNHFGGVHAMCLTNEKDEVATGTGEGVLRILNIKTKSVGEVGRHASDITALAVLPDSGFVASTSNDRTARIWDTEQRRELCRLVSDPNGGWLVIDPYGRFDRSDMKSLPDLHWIFPDNPFQPLSPEIFMRDYYEPKLLARVLAGEKLKPVPPLADLNRAQPLMKNIWFEETDQPDRVTVLVEVVSTSHEFILEGNHRKKPPGVYDVRLFRDGRLVGQYPKPKDKQYAISYDSIAEEKKNWKEETVVLEGEGSEIIRFEDIRLPCGKDIKQVEFTSYAFNEDRVKSVTSPPVIYELSNDILEVEPKAYLIAIGVKDYESSAWNLQYAANDATIFQEVVSGKLEKAGDYKIVPTTLISDGSQKTAAKAQIKACLKGLSDKVAPDDLVIVFFSSHGYTDKNGEFYILPYDIGKGREKCIELSQDMLRKCISSEELSRWLREIDGGEMVLIVDACHSAATVDQPGFKPGPMGNRGLGQLAYDKGMRVLAASQADDYAIEHPKVELGILTHALVRDGLEANQGDYKPNDGVIHLGEWLNYTVKRVPRLYQEVKEDKIQDFGLGTFPKTKVAIRDVPEEDSSLEKKNSFQQPALFDYSKTTKKVVF